MSLEKQREEAAFLEVAQNKLWARLRKEERQRFDFAETSQWLAFDKKEEDFAELMDKFIGWIQALGNREDKKTELTLLLKTIFRLQGYCSNLETITQTAVSKYTTFEKRIKELRSEKRLLELELIQIKAKHDSEIKSLKSEIEFIGKS